MQTADTGAEKKIPEGPGEAGEKKEATAPVAETVTIPKKDLDQIETSLAQAEVRIIGLRKDLDVAKKSGDGTLAADVMAEIEALKSEVEGLKSTRSVPVKDETAEELARARTTISELKKAAIHKQTTTNDAAGSGQPSPVVEKKDLMSQAVSPQDKEVLERVKARRIAQGRDPETGKMLAK